MLNDQPVRWWRTVRFGMMAMIFLMGWSSSSFTEQSPMPFARYSGHPPLLAVSFDYPEGWRPIESSGSTESYAQVQVLAPLALGEKPRTYLVVRAMPLKSSGGRYATVQEAVAAHEASLLPHLHIERRADVQRYGVTVTMLDVAGAMQMPFERHTPAPVPVKGQRLFFEKDARVYEVGWLAVTAAADQAAAAFAHLLDTLTFEPS